MCIKKKIFRVSETASESICFIWAFNTVELCNLTCFYVGLDIMLSSETQNHM